MISFVFKPVSWLFKLLFRLAQAHPVWLFMMIFGSRALAVSILMPIEHWSLVDGWYWSDAASMTIGYGDIAPKTALGRLIVEPFHYFWIFFLIPVVAARMVVAFFRNQHIFTHLEQEWMFRTVRMMFDWVRWSVDMQLRIAERLEVKPPPVPHYDRQSGKLALVPDEPPDTDFGSLDKFATDTAH